MQIWNLQEFSDVTLVTEDCKQISAHKVILSANSDFFRNILTQNPHPHPLVYLKDISHDHLESLVSFIYQGHCDIKKEEVEDFFKAGRHIGIHSLLEVPTERKTVKDRNSYQGQENHNRNEIQDVTKIEPSSNKQNILKENNKNITIDWTNQKTKQDLSTKGSIHGLDSDRTEEIISQFAYKNIDDMFVCKKCNSQFSKHGFIRHIMTKHTEDAQENQGHNMTNIKQTKQTSLLKSKIIPVLNVFDSAKVHLKTEEEHLEDDIYTQDGMVAEINIDGMYSCNQCNTQFSLYGLDRHMKKKHRK